MHSFLSSCRKAGKELTDAHGNAPSDEELSEALETTVARIKVRRVFMIHQYTNCSCIPFAVSWYRRRKVLRSTAICGRGYVDYSSVSYVGTHARGIDVRGVLQSLAQAFMGTGVRW